LVESFDAPSIWAVALTKAFAKFLIVSIILFWFTNIQMKVNCANYFF